jgi:MFS family permease
LLSTRLVARLRLDRLERRPGTSDRAVALVFLARSVDEILSGAWSVLTPTFRRAFDLTLVQVGLLEQLLSWVALVVEPPAATLVDLRSRRVLLTLGGTAVGVATVVMGAAPGYAALLAGFAAYGIGSGPLAHTADVVVVESFPTDPARAYNRATILDTCGAMAGPGLVAGGLALGLSWRWVLVALGLAAVAYGVALGRTTFPAPPARGSDDGLVVQAVRNVRGVVARPDARQALLLLFLFDVFESAFVLRYVWLSEDVGLPQAGVAAYAVGEQVVALLALAWLDRWLAVREGGPVLRGAAAALVVLPALWVWAPGTVAVVAVGVPLAAATAVVWPLARTVSLTAAPELAGATTAVTTLFPVVPLTLAQAALAQAIGIAPATAVTAGGAAVLLLLAAARRSGGGRGA